MSQAGAARVAVVGAGISGLAAAHRLVELSREHRRPLDLHVFEASDRPGGVIRTEQTEGFVIEAGPDAFLSEKPAAVRLCERLGISTRLVGTNEEFRRTYVVRGGRLCPLPEGFLLLAPTRLWPLLTTPIFSWPGKLRMALDLVLPRGGSDDESLASFVTRRLGRQALDRVAQPLVGGIYTADPARLSLAATMPRFLEMERTERSLILAMWRQRRRAALATDSSGARWSLFLSFDEGMQVLVDALRARLPPGALHCGRPITRIRRNGDGSWQLDDEPDFDAILLAIPAYAAAELIRPLDALLASELGAIEYASSATVTLAYAREDIPYPLDAFGFVVPHRERLALLAGTFSSLKYPGRAPASAVLTRAFVGGALRPELVDMNDRELAAAVRESLATLLGVRAEPRLARISRWRRSMPQYHLGHLARVARIHTRTAALGLHLAGNAYEGIGIPDCVRGAEAQAGALLAGLIS